MRGHNVTHTAAIIGVSTATIRNWARAGYIQPCTHKPLLFSDTAIAQLQHKLHSGALRKLSARANKQAAQSQIPPLEYATNPENLSANILLIQTLRHQHALDLSALLFFAALKYLTACGEVEYTPSDQPFSLQNFIHWQRSKLQTEMLHWHASLGPMATPADYADVFSKIQPVTDGSDFLGFLYQSLLNEGSKSKRGAYFTARTLVENALENKLHASHRFLDPCCGTGQYLLSAARHLPPENIYGIDIDPVSVRIARINLLRAYPDQNFVPQIYCANTLSEFATGDLLCASNLFMDYFDVIASNPPWGAHKNTAVPDTLKSVVKSGESFALFLVKSLTLLKPNGTLSFILPESILRIKNHADIRAWILRNTSITRITQLGRQFTGVFTPAIQLDLVKHTPPPTWQVEIIASGSLTKKEQAKFADSGIFDINVNVEIEATLKHIYAIPHQTLRGAADWALGIVTGNNAKYLSPTQDVGMEGILKGSDIAAFQLQTGQNFIRFTPAEFQQVAPIHLFRAPEKLIYRFISKTLVFAYDNQRQLTLNSANVLIPKLPNLNIKVALAFLNCPVFQYIFKHRFATHKVLRGDLETLPFPLLSQQQHDEIKRMTEAVLSGHASPQALDKLTFSAFQLSAEAQFHIQSTLRNPTWNS